jgi:hypothetical protein
VPSSPNENPPSSWTYRMEVSPTGQAPASVTPGTTDPVVLLHAMVSLQSQTLDVQRQILENQRQQLELAREAAQMGRDQRSRQGAELERWQHSHEGVIEDCRGALGQLETVHAALMADLARYVDENHENLVEGDFSLSDFVDRFGPRLAPLNTMLAVLRPLAAAQKKPENA